MPSQKKTARRAPQAARLGVAALGKGSPFPARRALIRPACGAPSGRAVGRPSAGKTGTVSLFPFRFRLEESKLSPLFPLRRCALRTDHPAARCVWLSL